MTKKINIEVETVIGHRERLSERAPQVGDAIVRSHTNNKYEKLAEMTNLLPEVSEGITERRTFTKYSLNSMGEFKFSLIDSNAEMPTRRNQEDLDRERLSERTVNLTDAIVWPLGNSNLKRLAEMTSLNNKALL